MKFTANETGGNFSETAYGSAFFAQYEFNLFYLQRGNKHYELTNHLGNVLTVITDKRLLSCMGDTVQSSFANIVSATDYSPFGAPLAGRTFSSEGYRFGFNGQERDDEVAGVGSIMTAEFWEYDTRLGRRWNLDPKPQIFISDYSVMGNNPILFLDRLGDSKQSRHLDKEGKMIAEYNDGDNSVYKHQTAKTKMDVDHWRSKFNNTSGNAVNIGQMSRVGLGVFNLNTFNPSKSLQFGYSDLLGISKKSMPIVNENSSSEGRVHLRSESVSVSFDLGADNPVDPNTASYFETIMGEASDEGITSINISSTTNHPSNSSRSAHSAANGARAFDMNYINGQHVSLNNRYVDVLQKIIQTTPGWRENYGPLIIQKMNNGTPIPAPWARDIPGGHYDHIHVSTPSIKR